MTQYQAGAAHVEITPPVGTELAGYTPRVRGSNRSTGIDDPLWARALALGDRETTILVVTLDLLGIELATTQHLRSRICQQLPLRSENILVGCTHNHSGPSILTGHETHVKVDPDWQAETLEATIAAAVTAYERLRPAQIGYGRAGVQNVGSNRRALLDDGTIFHFSGLYGRQPPSERQVVAAGPLDPELAVLCARDAAGQIIGLVANYACHPWIYNGDRISSEVAGACVDWLETQLGAANPGLVALFAPGTGSDITTVQHQTPLPEGVANKERWYTGERARLGAILGGAALQAIAAPELETTGGRITAGTYALAAPAYAQTLDQVLARHGRLPPPEASIQTEVQVLQVGEIVLVGLPTEVYVEYGLEIKRDSCYPQTMVLSYCNDYFADLITYQAVVEGNCPELAWTRVHPDVQQRIMDCLHSQGILGSKGGILGSKGGILGSKGGSLGSKGGSLGSKGGSLGSKGGSLVSKGGSLGSKGGSLGSKGGSLGSKGGSLGSKGGSLGSKGGILGSKGGILGSKGGILGSKGGILGSKGGSLGSKSGSLGNEDASLDSQGSSDSPEDV